MHKSVRNTLDAVRQDHPVRLSALIVAALVTAVMFGQAVSATAAQAAPQQRTDYVTSGDFHTLATLWHANAIGEFACPAGATIRVHYGAWIFSTDRQVQDLDCQTVKRLSVGDFWSLGVARMQIKVPFSTTVSWTYIPT